MLVRTRRGKKHNVPNNTQGQPPPSKELTSQSLLDSKPTTRGSKDSQPSASEQVVSDSSLNPTSEVLGKVVETAGLVRDKAASRSPPGLLPNPARAVRSIGYHSALTRESSVLAHRPTKLLLSRTLLGGFIALCSRI